MKKICAKVIPLVLLLTMIVSSFSFAISSFTDTGDHWASDIIEGINSKNIMPGYSDATFRAEANVTKLESIVAIYRAMKMVGKISADDEINLVAKHKATIESLGIPAMLAPYGADTYVACAYALENKIIVASELKYFLVDGELRNAKKTDVTIFLAKAINSYEKKNLVYDFYPLTTYNDESDLPDFSKPYIYSLIEKKILSLSGDNKGNFNPNSSVTRAILATMVLGTYDYMLAVEKSPSISNPLLSSPISTSDEQIESEKIEDEKTYSIVSGSVDQISVVDKGTSSEYTVVSVQTSSGKKEYFKVFSSTYVSLNGVKSSLAKLTVNDKVNISYEGYEAKGIESFGKIHEISGTSSVDTELTPGSKLILKMDDGSTFEQVITSESTVLSENNTIKKGDIVKVVLEYGLIKTVENTGMTSNDSGKIVEILIAENSKLSILNLAGVKKTYAMKDDTLMYGQDGIKLIEIYDLRLNSSVDLLLDINGISKLTAIKQIETVKIKGEIIDIFKSSNMFRLKSDEISKVYIVNFKSGSGGTIESYNIGDIVDIVGVELSNDLFEANLITSAN